MMKFHQDQFQRFLLEDQNKIINKEKEKVNKAGELEKTRLKYDEEYQRKQIKVKAKILDEEVEA
jgi:predicted PP-loop superfamily ATPase